MLRLPTTKRLCSLPFPSSSSPSLLPLPSSSSSHSFSTSSILSESKARRKARLSRKAHLDSKATLARSHALSAPDPVLGHARGDSALWAQSLLKGVLLDRKDVWGTTVAVLPDEKTGGAEAEAPSQEVDAGGKDEGARPQRLNFGLDEAQLDQLATALPLVSAFQATKAGGGLPISTATLQARFDSALALERAKRDALVRIVDLRNASAKGITLDNTRRIVSTFGTNPNDTGRPEVQAAILTARIHSLADHLTSQPRDVHNRRPLRSLIQQRAKVLKYLRSLDVKRYDDCLVRIGVDPRAVEGEVIVTKLGLRSIIRAA
ncbi:hypothetical protein RQP46_006916 [Phenoliferia psychrophenolica]